MAKEKIIGVQWIARSYLTDTEFMDKEVEGTYFRLINYIYLTQDRLEDDDAKLWQRCKCSSIKQYRAHKAELLKPRGSDPETGEEIPARLAIRYQNGPIPKGGSTPLRIAFLTSPKCTEQLGKSSKFRQAKSRGGKASAEKRKSVKNNDSATKSVDTDAPTERSTHYIQSGQQTGQQKSSYVPHNLKEFPTETPPPAPHPDPAASGSGSLGAPPDRPSAETAIADTEPVEVELPTGAKIRITAWGAVDEVYAPRDCPSTAMTRQDALKLRDETLRARAGPRSDEAA